jgi:hypothetical protein
VNDKNKKKLILVGVLVVALLGVVYMQFFRTDPKMEEYMRNAAQAATKQPAAGDTGGGATQAATTAAAAPNRSAFANSQVDIAELLDSVTDVTFDYAQFQIPRDPMGSLVGSRRPQLVADPEREGAPDRNTNEALRLARSMQCFGIIWDERNPMAMVDDEVVRLGQRLNADIVVQAIDRNRVTLRVDDTLVALELKEQ